MLPTCRLLLKQHSTRLTPVEITSLMVSCSKSEGKKRDYQINNTVIVYVHMKMLAKHNGNIQMAKKRGELGQAYTLCQMTSIHMTSFNLGH